MNAGEVLGHRYRLVDRLGVGGMSIVWRAHDQVLRRDVAVKVLAVDREHPGLSPDAIRSEAQAAAKLAHAHVANVFDYGEIVDSTGQTVPFVVMELLQGTTLATLIAEGQLRPEPALLACAQVAAALAEAHAHGLVHRDVKPSNVMMTAGGAKVFDFGIAVPIGTPDAPVAGAPILGTPAYVAPERITGGDATPAADVYALGVLLYRVLTDEYPWPAGSASHLLFAHVYGQARDLPDLDGVPASVQALYRRCVAKDPTERPTAAEAAAILSDASRSGALPDGEGTTRLDDLGPRRRFRIWPVAAGLTAAAATLVLIGLTQLADPAPLLGEEPAHAGPTASGGASGPTTTATPAETGGGGTPGPAAPGAVPTTPPATPAAVESPEPSSRPGDEQTFQSEGGWVVAGCDGDIPYLVTWQAADGYRGHELTGSPVRVAVAFRRPTIEIRLTITCPDGVPTATTTRKAVDQPPFS